MTKTKKKIGKDDILEATLKLINKDITIAPKLSHSANWITEYVNMEGILKNYDIGEEHEDLIALIEVTVTTGKKKEIRRKQKIWLDPRDILEIHNQLR